MSEDMGMFDGPTDEDMEAGEVRETKPVTKSATEMSVDELKAELERRKQPEKVKWINFLDDTPEGKLLAELKKLNKLKNFISNRRKEKDEYLKNRRVYMFPVSMTDLHDPFMADVIKKCPNCIYNMISNPDQETCGMLTLNFAQWAECEELLPALREFRADTEVIYDPPDAEWRKKWHAFAGKSPDISEGSLFLPSLPQKMKDADLQAMFPTASTITLVEEKPRKHAYVEFQSDVIAKAAVDTLNERGPLTDDLPFLGVLTFKCMKKLIPAALSQASASNQPGQSGQQGKAGNRQRPQKRNMNDDQDQALTVKNKKNKSNAGQFNGNLQQGGNRGQQYANRGRGNTPRGRGNTPRGRGITPRGRGNTPLGRGNTPRGRGNTPRGRGNTPRGRGNTYGGTGMASQGRGNTAFQLGNISNLLAQISNVTQGNRAVGNQPRRRQESWNQDWQEDNDDYPEMVQRSEQRSSLQYGSSDVDNYGYNTSYQSSRDSGPFTSPGYAGDREPARSPMVRSPPVSYNTTAPPSYSRQNLMDDQPSYNDPKLRSAMATLSTLTKLRTGQEKHDNLRDDGYGYF